MIIKAYTCVFWWSINRCWCFHLIHTGLVVVTAGYMAVWQALIWCPSYSLRHHHHLLLCHHLLDLKVSEDAFKSHHFAPSTYLKAFWSWSFLLVLFFMPTVSCVWDMSSSPAYLSGWSETAASVLRTQRRKGHVVFVSSQLLTSSCLRLFFPSSSSSFLLPGYGWHCCLLGLIFTMCWPQKDKKKMSLNDVRCYTPRAHRAVLFFIVRAWQCCISHAFLL